ncbi:MAG: antibiotic biosynthesis monooxygenase [Gallionella sp.]
MYSATFIFDKKQYDEEFYKLDNAIAEIAKGSTGYLGEESWENPENGRISNVYYWETMEGLQELINHPKHLEAKAAQSKWLNGYQVVISQVVRAYGDGAFPHPASSFTNG